MPKQMTNEERGDIRRLIKSALEREIAHLESADPEWVNRIHTRLRKIAIGQLGVDKEATELAKIDAELVKLNARREDVEKAIERKMPKQKQIGRSCPMPMDLCSAVAEITQRLFIREQLKDATGKKVDAVNVKYTRRLELLATCETRLDVEKRSLLG